MDYQSFIQSKIVRQKENLNYTLNQWRFKKKKIVFTNGCFDILHRGHVEYLAKAAELGDKLIIGLISVDHIGKTLVKPCLCVKIQIIFRVYR